jgi:hypothetical protein
MAFPGPCFVGALGRVGALPAPLPYSKRRAATGVGLLREAKSGLALRGSGPCSWRCCKGRGLASRKAFPRQTSGPQGSCWLGSSAAGCSDGV